MANEIHQAVQDAGEALGPDDIETLRKVVQRESISTAEAVRAGQVFLSRAMEAGEGKHSMKELLAGSRTELFEILLQSSPSLATTCIAVDVLQVPIVETCLNARLQSLRSRGMPHRKNNEVDNTRFVNEIREDRRDFRWNPKSFTRCNVDVSSCP